MANDPAADLAALLADQDMDGVTVQPTVGAGPGTIDGIFLNPYTDELDVESSSPTLTVASAAVSSNSIVRDSELTLGGVTYKVKGIQPNGWGLTVLILEAQ